MNPMGQAPGMRQDKQTKYVELNHIDSLWNNNRSPYKYMQERQEQYINEDIKVFQRPHNFLYES